MRTLPFAVLLLVMSGCVAAPAPASVPAMADEDETVAPPRPAPVVTITFPGNATTTEDRAEIWLNTTVEVEVKIRRGEVVVASDKVPQTRTWRVPVDYGANELVVEARALDFFHQTSHVVVRLAPTSLVVNYGVFHPHSQGVSRSAEFDIWIDVSSRPSAPAYAAQGISHADAFTAHDHLVVFSTTTGTAVDFEYFQSFQGFGVNRIDGAGSPISSGAPPWWCYSVNGQSADGISIQPIHPGDAVIWTLGSCA